MYWPVFMQAPRSCRGQRSREYLISFNGSILYIASLPVIKETFERFDIVEREKKEAIT